MTNDRRKLIYMRQNGSDTRLTGAQRRRLRKHLHDAPTTPTDKES